MFSGRAMGNSIQKGGNPYKIYYMYSHVTLKMCHDVLRCGRRLRFWCLWIQGDMQTLLINHHRRSAHFLFARWLYIAFAHSPCPIPCVPWRQTTLCSIICEVERRYIARKHGKKAVKIKPVSKRFDRPGPACDS